MTEEPWKFTDATETVVFRPTPGGGMESHLVSVQEVQDWIKAGNAPLPADQLKNVDSTPTKQDLQAQIDTLQAQVAALPDA